MVTIGMSIQSRFYFIAIFTTIVFFCFLLPVKSEISFNEWLEGYKKTVLKKGISQKTIDLAFKNVVFLDKVIIYDRKQPEFYEDTITYVTKRANLLRINKAKKLLQTKIKKINIVQPK